LFPIPNANSIWPQFRSPLLWDVFAVSTYFTVSVLFWYMGLIPDLATMRDRFRKVAGKVVVPAARLRNKAAQVFYGLFSLGWTGSSRHWRNYEKAYLLLAGLSTPLVLSVHSIVSFDFAVSQLPGWHTTIFPPYFVAGAVFSGFGMVLTLMIPLRSLYRGMDEIVTTRHLEFMCKVTLTTGSIVGYAYGMEFFIAYYSGNPYELYAFKNRAFGDYYWSYWVMVSCNVISPHLFWFKWCRTTPWFIWVVSILVNIGMWMERFVIVVTSLHNDYMPGNWGYYTPTWVDVMTYIGTLGFFMTLFLLFCRFLPLVAISEVKGVTPFADPHHPLGGAKK
jgi:molybdopterin-containing oxidoreductase family membrane subunit